MQQIVNIKYSSGPSARKPRHERSPLSALGSYQGGRVRTWLQKNAGLACVAVSWVFIFAMLVSRADGEITSTSAACAILGASLMGFGIGWIVRDERGRK